MPLTREMERRQPMTNQTAMDKSWNWAPDMGRWRLDQHGYPSLPSGIAISTAAVAQVDAYEFWREIAFTDFAANAPSPDAKRSFQASATGFTSSAGDLFVTQSDAISGSRARKQIESDGLDSISLGMVLKGSRRAIFGQNEESVSNVGGLFVYDGSMPSSISWTRHDAIYLVMRRGYLQEELGTEIPSVQTLSQRVSTSPLKQILFEKMAALGRYAPLLSPREKALLLEQANEICRFAMLPASQNGQVAASGSLIVANAMSFIERHCAEINLDVDMIVKALKCSRATLYRAFAAEGLKVAECIRTVRLERARILLDSLPPGVPIASIAEQCGLFDAANLSRQFKRLYGVSPTDFRRRFR